MRYDQQADVTNHSDPRLIHELAHDAVKKICDVNWFLWSENAVRTNFIKVLLTSPGWDAQSLLIPLPPMCLPSFSCFFLSCSLSAGPLYRLAIKSPIFAAGHFSLSQHSPPPPPLYLIISSEKANDPLRDREQEKKERERVRESGTDAERCSGLKRKATKKKIQMKGES